MHPRLALLLITILAAGCGARTLTVGPEIRIGPPRFRKRRNQHIPQVCAVAKDQYLVVWQEGYAGVGGESSVLGCSVREGTPRRIFSIALGIPAGIGDEALQRTSEVPVVAHAARSGKALVIWQELVRGKQYDIRGFLFPSPSEEPPPGLQDLSGMLPRSAHLPVLTLASTPHNEVLPSVASDGKDFLVAWAEYSPEAKSYAPVCARVSSEGKLLDKEPVRLSKSGAAPKAVYNGRDYVVVYDKRDSVWARRVSTGGELLDKEALKPSGLMGNAPAVASDGRDAVVLAARVPRPNAWGWHGPAAITAGRVTRAGKLPERELNKKMDYVVLASEGAANVLDRADWKGREGWPASWRGDFPGTTNGTWPTTPMAIASDGREYVAVWTRARLGAYDPCVFADLDLFAARVSRRARIRGEPVPAANAPGTQTRPAIASARRGEWLLVYESVRADGSVAVYGRLLKLK